MADYSDADFVCGTDRQSCGVLADDCAAAAANRRYHCGIYGADVWCIRQADSACAEERRRKKWNNPLCNPIVVSVILIAAVLLLLKLPNEEYQSGWAKLSWLLTPATICLALPMYEQLRILRKDLPAILAGVAGGTLTSLGCIFGLGRLFGLNVRLVISLLPKSVTTAMGIALSEQYGGIGAITSAAIIVTGIGGSICGRGLCELFRIQGEVVQGVAFGTAAHVIGTSKATELSELCGAVGSLSLVVTGVLTATLLPALTPFFSEGI